MRRFPRFGISDIELLVGAVLFVAHIVLRSLATAGVARLALGARSTYQLRAADDRTL